ncbi:hypothetical protein X801_02096, partial [Opisthorchis viverrini]
MDLDGVMECEVEFRGARFSGALFVSSNAGINLMGMDWIENLGLLDMPLNKVCTQSEADVRRIAVPTYVL